MSEKEEIIEISGHNHNKSDNNDHNPEYTNNIKKEKFPEKIPYSQELIRKSIHLVSLLIPITYIFINTKQAILILIPLALIVVGLDITSKRFKAAEELLNKFFGKILRKHEKKKKMVLNGASWVLISAVLCVLTFPKTLMITGFTILIISDISAALIGRRYGRHDLFGKSVEGTTAFILSAFIVILIYYSMFSAPWTYMAAGFIASFIAGIVEAGSRRLDIDDNLSIPITVCLMMWGFNLFLEGSSLDFLNLIK